MPRPVSFGMVYTGIGIDASEVRDAILARVNSVRAQVDALEADATVNLVFSVGSMERPPNFDSFEVGAWSNSKRLLRVDVPVPCRWRGESVAEGLPLLVDEALEFSARQLELRGYDVDFVPVMELFEPSAYSGNDCSDVEFQ